MAVRVPHIPKIRVRADLALIDGTVLHGHVFVEATVRVQDLMNDPLRFFPFIDESGALRLINKEAVAQVRPHD